MAFLCDAIYRGSHIVEGAVSPPMLTTLAEVVLNSDHAIRGYAEICIDKLPRGERCQLQIDEERLRVTSSRKDEGFESDSEASSSSSTTGFDETLCGSPEIKVINDHVLRLEKLIRQDSGIHRCISQSSEDGGSTSLSSSSGAESEEETPKTKKDSFKDLPLIHPTLEKTSKEGLSKDAKFTQMDTGIGDNFFMSDILFCHVLSNRPKVLIVVVKSVDSNLIAAHVFECLSAEASKTLYSCYYTASNKYKLNRYRISKRRSEGVALDDKAVLDRFHVSIRNIKRKNKENQGNFINCQFNNGSPKSLPVSNSNFSNAQNSSRDSSNINIIEIKDSKPDSIKPNGMMQRIDEHGVTHIEIESAPCSLAPINVTNQNQKLKLSSSDLLSALDRLSIHSSNNPDSYLNFIGVTSSCPNSLIQASREILAAGEREVERKSRQRQPPLLLKKEAFRKAESLSRKEVTKRSEQRRNRSRSEEGRRPTEIDNQYHLKSSVETNAEESLDKLISESSKCQPKDRITPNFREELPRTEDPIFFDRQTRSRSTSRPAENRGRIHNKGPAPPPPPRRHPNNPSLMLVPTKSGQENTKAYYPKESHIVRGSKIVRIDYPVYPPWNINSDSNNNPRMMFYSNRGWFGSHEFHVSRRNDSSVPPDIRKRSRSKSPARRPMAHRYIDAVSTFSLTQKIRDISDTVIQSWKNNTVPGSPGSNVTMFPLKDGFSRVNDRKERKMNAPLSAAHFISSNNKYNNSNNNGGDDVIRPVIKKGKRSDNSDVRRVTFSAYATVQLMDS